MKCPVCGTERPDDVLRCERCGAESAPGAGAKADPALELVCIEEVTEASRCAVIASLLEAEGIPVALHNAVGPVLRGISDGPFAWDAEVGGVRVMVPRAFEQEARDLLAAPAPVAADEDPPADA